MQNVEHFRQRFRAALRRVRDEMVMIREHRPRLELPLIFRRELEQSPFEHPEPERFAKAMRLLVSDTCDEIRAAFAEAMRRRSCLALPPHSKVAPRRFRESLIAQALSQIMRTGSIAPL